MTARTELIREYHLDARGGESPVQLALDLTPRPSTPLDTAGSVEKCGGVAQSPNTLEAR